MTAARRPQFDHINLPGFSINFSHGINKVNLHFLFPHMYMRGCVCCFFFRNQTVVFTFFSLLIDQRKTLNCPTASEKSSRFLSLSRSNLSPREITWDSRAYHTMQLKCIALSPSRRAHQNNAQFDWEHGHFDYLTGNLTVCHALHAWSLFLNVFSSFSLVVVVAFTWCEIFP